MRDIFKEQSHAADTCKFPSLQEFKELKTNYNVTHADIVHTFHSMRKVEALEKSRAIISALKPIHPRLDCKKHKTLLFPVLQLINATLFMEANANAS